MIFELPDIFFGSHKKRKGITTTAGETVRIYKKGRKSLTTSGFFKKSGDIFFGATSHKIQASRLGFFFCARRRNLVCAQGAQHRFERSENIMPSVADEANNAKRSGRKIKATSFCASAIAAAACVFDMPSGSLTISAASGSFFDAVRLFASLVASLAMRRSRYAARIATAASLVALTSASVVASSASPISANERATSPTVFMSGRNSRLGCKPCAAAVHDVQSGTPPRAEIRVWQCVL